MASLVKHKTGVDAASTEKGTLSEVSQPVRSDTVFDSEEFESKKDIEDNKKQLLLLSLSGDSESNSDDHSA
jgi:hypothetical protein